MAPLRVLEPALWLRSWSAVPLAAYSRQVVPRWLVLRLRGRWRTRNHARLEETFEVMLYPSSSQAQSAAQPPQPRQPLWER